MNPLFIEEILLSFIVAGIWITIVTVIAERFGSKMGGIFGNLPSNILVSLLFIGLTQAPQFAANSASIVPLAMAIDTVFLFVFIVTAEKFGKASFAVALLTWFLLALPLGGFQYSNIIIGVIIYVIITALLTLVVVKKLDITHMKKRNAEYTLAELSTRGLISGGIVATTVAIAAAFGPLWGGIFATFPAVMFSTMYLLTRSQGADFARAAGKTMLPASANIIVYAISVNITYPLFGLGYGTAISYAAALIFVLLAYPFLSKMK